MPETLCDESEMDANGHTGREGLMISNFPHLFQYRYPNSSLFGQNSFSLLQYYKWEAPNFTNLLLFLQGMEIVLTLRWFFDRVLGPENR